MVVEEQEQKEEKLSGREGMVYDFMDYLYDTQERLFFRVDTQSDVGGLEIVVR